MYQILDNVPLQEYNSFRIPASARRVISFENIADLKHITPRFLLNQPWKIIGGGNNILFTENYNGTLIHPAGQKITPLENNQDHILVHVEAGVSWDHFVQWAVQNGYGGIENLSLIPGQVGAAPVQNIGAYGVEVKDAIQSVECFIPEEQKTVSLTAEQCLFGYRSSIFKHTLSEKAVITGVFFRLTLHPQCNLRYGELLNTVHALGEPSLENIRQAVIQIRQSKIPDPQEIGNAGSFFKNPVVSQQQAEELLAQFPDMPCFRTQNEGVKLAAGWLIDQCGWKGKAIGPAAVHHKQALILVNLDNASGQQILTLAHQIQDDVARKFNVKIEMEVNVW